MNIVSQKKITSYLHLFNKKLVSFLQNGQNVAHILVSCFSKLRNFRPSFDFVFREISRNSRKMFAKHEIENFEKISRNYWNSRSHHSLDLSSGHSNPYSYRKVSFHSAVFVAEMEPKFTRLVRLLWTNDTCNTQHIRSWIDFCSEKKMIPGVES